MSFKESVGGYEDAVGDIGLIDDKWGPSCGLFQIRSLRKPYEFSIADRYRQAWACMDRLYNARAAFVISKEGTDWAKWSVYRNGTYLPHVGQDYIIRTGHERAHLWNS